MLNVLFSMTKEGARCEPEMFDAALDNILDTLSYAYSDILFRMTEKQKRLLIALAKDNGTNKILTGDFAKKSGLGSPSSVQSAANSLLEKDFVSCENGVYSVCDRFLQLWITRHY